MRLPFRFTSSSAPRWLLGGALASCLLSACASSSSSDPTGVDQNPAGGGDDDAGTDEPQIDASIKKDSGTPKPTSDAGKSDAGQSDAGVGTGIDAGKSDAGKSDAGPSSTPDATTGAPDATTSAPDTGTSTPPANNLCHLMGDDVAVLGDSYIQLSGDFTRLLQETARTAGALGANDTYVDHSLSGASMNGFPNIPSQWPDALADSKRRGSTGPKLVIMDGGGNDVLVNNRTCLDPTSVAAVEQNATCVKVVDDTLTTAQKLFNQAVSDGVKATIFFFYPHLPKDSVGAGPNANNILDYSTPRAKELCDKQTKAPCYFVDMRAAFNDPNNDGWPKDGLIAFDGIHPTLMGSTILAAEVWKVMQAQCLAAK